MKIKKTTLSFKHALSLIFTFALALCLSLEVTAALKPLSKNWPLQKPSNCVDLSNANHELVFDVIVTLSGPPQPNPLNGPFQAGHPDMFASYSVQSQIDSYSGVTGQITNSNLQYMGLYNGVHYYEAKFNFVFDFSQSCLLIGPNFEIEFTGELLTQVAGSYIPYPCAEYHHADDIFDPIVFGSTLNCTDIDTKFACCEGAPIKIKTEDTPSIETSLIFSNENKSGENVLNSYIRSSPDFANISPNPFSGFIQIELIAEKTSSTQIEILNMNGLSMLYKEIEINSSLTNVTLNTVDLPQGVYIARMISNGVRQSFKIVKLE